MAETTYEAGVKIVFDAMSATGAAANFRKAIQLTQGSVVGLSEKLHRARQSLMGWTAGQLGVGLGLGALIHSSYEANQEMGKLQKSIAGALFGFSNWKTGVDEVTKVKAAMASAKETLDKFEETESRLAIPIEELSGAYRFLAGPAMGKFGLTAAQTTSLTENLAGAAKVLGTDVSSAGMQLTRLLETRNLRGVDPLTNFFRRTIGEGKELKKLAPDKLVALLSTKMATLGPAAQEMSKGMSGTMFRLRDFFRDTIRDIGGPAFKYIAEQTEKFRKALEATVGPGQKLGDVVGSQIVRGLKLVVGFTTTILTHWKEIALIIGGIKIAGMGAGMAGGMLEGISGFTKNLGLATVALGALWMAANAFADWVNKKHEENIEKRAVAAANIPEIADRLMQMRSEGLIGQGGRGNTSIDMYKSQAGVIVKMLQQTGAIGKGGEINRLALSSMVGQMTIDERRQLAKSGIGSAHYTDVTSMTNAFAKELKRIVPFAMARFGERGDLAKTGVPKLEDLTTKKPPKFDFHGNIYINQKFEDADPDNVYVRLKDDIARETNAKTQHEGYSGTEP
jgi:hypothetical protein